MDLGINIRNFFEILSYGKTLSDVLIELVSNSWDADSSTVEITFPHKKS